MPDKRECEFTNAVKPIGMRHPLHVEILKKNLTFISYFLRLLRQVVEDDAVVNALYSCFRSFVIVIQISAFAVQISKRYGFNTSKIFCAVKINSCFLLLRQYFQQNHFLRQTVADDYFFQ